MFHTINCAQLQSCISLPCYFGTDFIGICMAFLWLFCRIMIRAYSSSFSGMLFPGSIIPSLMAWDWSRPEWYNGSDWHRCYPPYCRVLLFSQIIIYIKNEKEYEVTLMNILAFTLWFKISIWFLQPYTTCLVTNIRLKKMVCMMLDKYINEHTYNL